MSKHCQDIDIRGHIVARKNTYYREQVEIQERNQYLDYMVGGGGPGRVRG